MYQTLSKPNAKHVGDLLREWRELNGLTLYVVGKAIGMRIETLRRLEQGRGTMDSLIGYLHVIKHLDSRRDARTLYNAIWEAI